MNQLSAHLSFGIAQQWRQPLAALRLLVLLPFAEVLPLLLLGTAFLTPTHAEALFMTNVVWVFVTATVIQAVVWTETLLTGDRLDAVLLSDQSLLPWLVGTCLSVNALYAVSTGLVCALVAVLVGYSVTWLLLPACALSAVVGLSLASVAVALRLRFGPIFHLINAGLDVLKVLSCVLYPLTALAAIAQPVAGLSPVTHLNEFLRTTSWTPLGTALLLAAGLAGLALFGLHRATIRYQVTGDVVRER